MVISRNNSHVTRKNPSLDMTYLDKGMDSCLFTTLHLYTKNITKEGIIRALNTADPAVVPIVPAYPDSPFKENKNINFLNLK